MNRAKLIPAGIYVPDPSKTQKEKEADFHNYCMSALVASAKFKLTPEESKKAIETLRK